MRTKVGRNGNDREEGMRMIEELMLEGREKERNREVNEKKETRWMERGERNREDIERK